MKRTPAELHAAFSDMVGEIAAALGAERAVLILRRSAELIELELVKDAISKVIRSASFDRSKETERPASGQKGRN